LAALQTESTGFSFVFYPCLLFSLPRQFHTAIVENNKETHPNPFGFSVVPATFQPFVFPIALAVIFF
jgi:hypothetical protein